MKELLREARKAKGMTVAELSRQTGIDKALINKFELGSRTPTKPQLSTLANLLGLDYTELEIRWLTAKILAVCEHEPLAEKALERVTQKLSGKADLPVDKLLEELEALKNLILKK